MPNVGTRNSPLADFRADINGLRALAVSAVLLFHFNVPGFAGGFAGVDVFFVISGYLMTSIISRRLNDGNFSTRSFYRDRLLRIAPALVVLCGAMLVFGWFCLHWYEYRKLARHILASLGFVSNIVYFNESGYFDHSPFKRWLLHTWSLSVEFQFYVLYPLLCSLVVRWFGWRRVLPTVAAVAALSFAVSVYASQRYPSAAFYLLPMRAWELLAGAVAFFLPAPASAVRARALGGTGLLLIVASVMLISERTVWPGWAALAPVFGTAMVITASMPGTPLATNRVVQFLGRISYSVYLWHWPIAVALGIGGVERQPVWLVAGSALSLVLGTLSYQFVEGALTSAIRRGLRLSRQSTPTEPERGPSKWVPSWPRTGLLAGALVLTSAWAVLLLAGVPGALRTANHDPKMSFLAKYEILHKEGLAEAYWSKCDFRDWDSKSYRAAIDPTCISNARGTGVFLWGDSHAQSLSWGLRQLFGSKVGFSQVATSGCSPFIDKPVLVEPRPDQCRRSNEYALRKIAAVRPAVVVVAQARGHEKTDWQALSAQLHALGVRRVVLVGPLPQWYPSLPEVIVTQRWGKDNHRIAEGLSQEAVATNAALSALGLVQAGVTFVSPIGNLCDSRGCIAIVPGGNELFAVDYGHLTPAASLYLAREILADIL